MSRSDSKFFLFFHSFSVYFSLSPSTCPSTCNVNFKADWNQILNLGTQPENATLGSQGGVGGPPSKVWCAISCAWVTGVRAHPKPMPPPLWFLSLYEIPKTKSPWKVCTYLPKALRPLNHCFTWQNPSGPSTARLSNEYAYVTPILMIIPNPAENVSSAYINWAKF